MSEEMFSQLSSAIIEGDQVRSKELTNIMLEAGQNPKSILDEGLIKGMEVVGIKFRENLIFVPQVLISARAFKSSLAILEPLLAKSETEGNGTVIIGTVKGDIHDIGKNIVAMMLRSSGFRVVDLGIDVRVEKFISAIREEKAIILGMSALLTTTMGYMKTVIDKIREENISIPVMVGGAPVNRSFAEQINAEGYAKNASDAVELAKQLIK